MAFPKNLNKLKTFSSWPANYRFAYAMDIVGIFVCLGFFLFGNQPAEGRVLLGLGFIVCLALGYLMPGWALNDEEEKAKRAWRK
ncbi:hypothetical protein [Corynebacterium stationis]|uniref:hypothetical protein n=1 Tax=Corynebacterium stationis TaxID=1705 RepID=UPI000950C956|nr:hypothetical protein [Corynebacterium stationis]